MSTIQIFAYRNNLGATSDLENGKFINNVSSPGQLGVIAKSSDVEITKEAKELLRKAKREGGSFSEIMLTKHIGDAVDKFGNSSVGLLGFNKHHFGTEFSISRDCVLSVLDEMVETEMEAPEDYRKFIDEELGFSDAVDILTNEGKL